MYQTCLHPVSYLRCIYTDMRKLYVLTERKREYVTRQWLQHSLKKAGHLSVASYIYRKISMKKKMGKCLPFSAVKYGVISLLIIKKKKKTKNSFTSAINTVVLFSFVKCSLL